MLDAQFFTGLFVGLVLAILLSRLTNSKKSRTVVDDERVQQVKKRKTPEEKETTPRTSSEGPATGDEEDIEEDEEELEEERRVKESLDTKEWHGPVDAPHFPFLRISNLLEHASPERIFPNTRTPQNFETSRAKAKALIALRVKGAEDPHFEPFFQGKNRRFEIQFQITLKEKPRGIIYLGGEVPDKMQLGIVTKGLCRAILSILNKLSSTIHAGFGKNMNDTSERELPHIVFPLWAAATQLVVTKANSSLAPPTLGTELPESLEQKKLRVKQAVNLEGDLDKGDTITFSIHSMYLDIVRWKATNLGALGEMDLSMFWDTMPLHIVMYDLPSFTAKNNKVHSQALKQFFFAFSLQNTYFERQPGEHGIVFPAPSSPSASGARSGSFSRRLSSRSESLLSTAEEGGDIGEDDDSYQSRDDSSQGSPTSASASATKTQSNNQFELSTSDVRVIAWIERKGRKSSVVSFVVTKSDGTQYFLQSKESFFTTSLSPTLSLLNEEMVQKPKKTWEWETLRGQLDKAFQVSETVTLPPGWLNLQTRLLSASSRDEMGVTLAAKYLDSAQVILECPLVRPLWETKWVEEWAIVIETKTNAGHSVVFLLLYRTHSKTPALVLSNRDMLTVVESTPMATPFSGFFPAVQIETVGRVLQLGFSTQSARGAFVECLRSARPMSPRGIGSPTSASSGGSTAMSRMSPSNSMRFVSEKTASGNDLMLTSDTTTVSLEYESNRWGSQKRTIINSRQIVFKMSNSTSIAVSNTSTKSDFNCFKSSSGGGAVVPSIFEREFTPDDDEPEGILAKRRRLERKSLMKPWELSAALLRSALSMNDSSTLSAQIAFFDQACLLRQLDIVGWSAVMTEEEKMCFALNLYHALRLHAKFLVGQPSSILGWSSFGSRISYAIGSGTNSIVLSLAEIEHCILRKPMSLARTFLSTSYSSTPYTRMLELSQPEPRLNFCLNYGTKSCSEHIVVLSSPSTVDKLLDRAAQDSLAQTLKVDRSRCLIAIPKLCYWYGRDFLPDGKDLTAKGIGREIVHYLGDQQREETQDILLHADLVFRVRAFKWKCLDRQTELQI